MLETPRWSRYTIASPGSTSCKAKATSLSLCLALRAILTVRALNSSHLCFASSNTGQVLAANLRAGCRNGSLRANLPWSSILLDLATDGSGGWPISSNSGGA
eukprot:GHVR01067926.1.p2 GENE.GHVR01067926.1~~GHVR01067926.1.p2  ORF type:complete len:102 (-),score=2.43 GHVR01067926.1:363-668(-)